MSSEDRKLAGSAIVVLAIIALEIAWFLIIGPPTDHGADQATNHEAKRLLLGLSGEEWTAAFTGVLTVSTIGLWISTNSSVRLARDEFNSSHRPRIIVHSVRYEPIFGESGDSDQDKPAATVIFYNTGESPAIIESINFSIAYRRIPLESGLFPKKQITPRSKEIESGIGDYIRLESSDEIRMWKLKADGVLKLVMIGKIFYHDKAGGLRQTGFCRALEYGENHTLGWQRIDDPEYEYGY